MGVHYLDYLDTLVGELKPLAYSDDAKGGIESSLQYDLAAGDVQINMRLSRIHQMGAYVKIDCERGQIRVNKSNDNEVIVTPNGSLNRRVSAEGPFDDPAWPKDFHGSFCQMLSDFERAIGGRSTRIADAADAERTAALIEWAYDRRHRPKTTMPIHSARTKVLVTGATGFIGGHLVERLTLEGDSIRVAARTPGTCANVSRFPVEIVQTNLLDGNSVSAAVAGSQYVYHLAVGNDGSDNARITIDGTKNVVEASIEAGVDCVVVLSTMYVFGFPRGVADVDESFPYRPYGGEYGRSKAIMEQWCLDRARSSLPTRIVILNPTCVFGPGGSVYTILPVELAQQDQFCWISDGIGLCNYNYVDNLIDAIVAATQVPEAHGNRFIINDGAVSWREFLGPLIAPITPNVPSYTRDELARLPRYGGPFRFADLIKAIMSASEIRTVAKRSVSIRKVYAFMSRFKSRTPPGQTHITGKNVVRDSEIQTNMPPEGLASLYHSERVTFSANKAKEILGWSPRIDLAAAQAATLQWLAKSGRLQA